MAVATIVILSVLLSIHLLPSKVSLKLGDTGPEDIIAHRRASYVDIAETSRKRRQAAEGVRKFYDPEPRAADQADSAVKTVFQTIEIVRDQYPLLPMSEKVRRVRERLGALLGSRISTETFAALLSMDPDGLREIRDGALRIVSAAMSKHVYDDQIQAARAKVNADAKRLFEDSAKAELVTEVARDSIRPNQTFNEGRTMAARQKARENVQAELRAIEPGDVVIAKGDTVFEEHIQKFIALGLRNPKLDYRSAASLTLLVVVAVLLVLGYLSRYHQDIYTNTKTLLLVALIVVLSVTALRVGGSMLGIKLSPTHVGYFGVLWVVTAAMFLAVLVNPQVSIVIAALLSIVLSLMLNNELRYAATALVMSLVGIYSVANIRDRGDLLRAIAALAGAGLVLVWIMGGLSGDAFSQMVSNSVWAIAIAVAPTLLLWIGTELFERLFGRTTHISLFELANTNKPLLRRLVMEAPGTYTHSVAVGYLAETAAEAIGADSLVARVASYYHDIGKIRRPHFFVENQHVENIHDQMNPTLSALVITSHIKDGVETAKKSRLPKIVLDVIMQHHGTSLVQYFYNQVAGEQEACTALEQQFRYSGPKPRTKEAAIVMLADSVEAASRCIAKPTPAKIELLVSRIVAEKLRDGQLDESDLTFKETSKIADTFVKTLTATLHARIDYPDAASTEGKRLISDGDSDPEFAKNAGETAANEEDGREAATG